MERTLVTSHNSPPRFSWDCVLTSCNLLEPFMTLRLFQKVRKQKVRKRIFGGNKLLLNLNSHYAHCKDDSHLRKRLSCYTKVQTYIKFQKKQSVKRLISV